MAGVEQRAREVGCDDCDTKPIGQPQWLEKIHSQLGSRPEWWN
jgi:CheY-like chemotaxis protein